MLFDANNPDLRNPQHPGLSGPAYDPRGQPYDNRGMYSAPGMEMRPGMGGGGYGPGPGFPGPDNRFASGPGDYGAGAGAYSNDYRGGGGGVFPMKKEFFLNITVDERDRAEVAGSILKEHGRKALGRAGSVMGGLVGSVAGHANIGDGLIAENLSKTVRQYIEEILEHDGWRCIVKTVMFPPLDGTMWREYISLPNGGIFLTQRVQILHRDTNLVGGPNGSSSWFSHLLNMRECCCPPEAPDYNRYTGNTIVNSLQNKFRGRTPPINPYIDAANAMEEVNHLQRMQGFEPRVAEQVIIRSRGVNGDGR